MNLIAAVDKNWGIGYGGELLFSIPGDKKYFRELTVGKVVIMGRKTFQSLPDAAPLPDRMNIVLTENADALLSFINLASALNYYSGYLLGQTGADKNDPEKSAKNNLTICNSLSAVAGVIADYNTEDVFVIGGQDIYEQYIGQCETAYITKVDVELKADRYLPNIDKLPDWTLSSVSPLMKYRKYEYAFCKYVNNGAASCQFPSK